MAMNRITMHARSVRFLVLLSSLVLVPPPGWCCLVARPAPESRQTKTCCGCPHCQRSEAQTSRSEQPPAESSKCPCFDRHTTLSDASRPLATDATVVTTLVVPAALPPGAGLVCPDRAVAPLASSSLHLIHCVWLC
jgi:hypothetical protein